MSHFKKISDTKAQHTLEYSILLILIMAGIIISGPYVVRSWNANLKGWDDAIQDSFEDPLLSSAPDDTPLEGCDLDATTEEGCGLGRMDPCTGETVACGPRQMLTLDTYSPAGCQCAVRPEPPETIHCSVDNDCCEYTPGECGALGGCPDDQRQYDQLCGNNAAVSVCGYLDPAGPPDGFVAGDTDPLCVFRCQIPPEKITSATDSDYGDVCPDAETGLADKDTHYSYVDAGWCTGAKCEIECDTDAVSYGTYCSPCENWGMDTTGCPAGQYLQGSCPAGEYVPCCIPPPCYLTEALGPACFLNSCASYGFHDEDGNDCPYNVGDLCPCGDICVEKFAGGGCESDCWGSVYNCLPH